MANTSTTPTSPPGEPGRVTFLDAQGGLPMVEVATAWSTAEICFHGAHVTRFQKAGEPDLLFLSRCSRFVEGQPIRGGIPVIFPWFGAREGMPQHGFARTQTWDLKEIQAPADGSVRLRFTFPPCPAALTFPPFQAEYTVSVKDTLELSLRVRNESGEEPLTLENCLHTYLAVADVTAIAIHGLRDTEFLDKVANFARRRETAESLRISSEVDRIYVDTTTPVEVLDPRLGRRITITKSGSASTIVWNPWIAKAQQMPDFGNEEYREMVCVESGNVGPNELKLAPGAEATLTVKLASVPLA